MVLVKLAWREHQDMLMRLIAGAAISAALTVTFAGQASAYVWKTYPDKATCERHLSEHTDPGWSCDNAGNMWTPGDWTTY
ncbi:hypothetical protein [Nocardia abscessus]|uniref:hypothetical protein n=1 Tax=Nocardia abscessus TaxID=120957 RepID=UPI002458ADC6|nr:hypothetical protein [Nocardia abscessus]